MDALVYIASPGHTGSTILDLLLGEHPEIVSLGEVQLIDRWTADPERSCTCGAHVLDCPFWGDVQNLIRDMLGRQGCELADLRLEVRKPKDELHRRGVAVRDVTKLLGSRRLWAAAVRRDADCAQEDATNLDAAAVYEAACQSTGARFVVDSSKSPGTLKNRTFAFGDRFKIIWQTRDGRAVCASQMRRDGCSMDVAAHDWRRRVLNLRLAMLSIPRRAVLRVDYADLCRDPLAELSRVGTFMGTSVPFEHAKLRKNEAHNIGGNALRYRRDETSVKFDEKWRSQLSDADLRTFSKVTGPLNRMLGYTA